MTPTEPTPACPDGHGPMHLTRTDANRAGARRETYDCPNCGKQLVVLR